MKIRFLQTVPSEVASFPFVAGQVIEVPAPSAYLLNLLDGVRAEVVREDPTDLALDVERMTPEPVRVRKRRAE